MRTKTISVRLVIMATLLVLPFAGIPLGNGFEARARAGQRGIRSADDELDIRTSKLPADLRAMIDNYISTGE